MDVKANVPVSVFHQKSADTNEWSYSFIKSCSKMDHLATAGSEPEVHRRSPERRS